MRQKDHISAEEYKSLKSEHQIQTEIINYLAANNWYTQRMNSGVIPQTDRNGKQRRIFMGKRGTPDIMAFKLLPIQCGTAYHQQMSLLFIEVKRPGNKPTFAQEQMMQELREYGARCIVAHSVEELENKLREGVNI